ncbi:unnamed protein product [Heligmosomoides polygyrus]|uniref:Uncharacterized protein n=1 Tax=Heligmosomoides polygyrus TaxID=6339 RepID=A0A183G2T2_HELPZ|nr:unnamed protein product [Heligmosomoides polygyrus]
MIFCKRRVMGTYECTMMAEREPLPYVVKARSPRCISTVNSDCGRQMVFTHPRRESGFVSLSCHVAEAISSQKPKAKRVSRKTRLTLPEVSEESKKKAPAAIHVPRPRVAKMQQESVTRKEPVGQPLLAKQCSQLQLSKIDGEDVDCVKTAMGEVYAELIRYLTTLERRIETWYVTTTRRC